MLVHVYSFLTYFYIMSIIIDREQLVFVTSDLCNPDIYQFDGDYVDG